MSGVWHNFYRLAAQFPPLDNSPSGETPLAYGGNLSPSFLLAGYSRGFFPWYNEGDPILWWSPDPRCVLLPENFRVSKRSARKMASLGFTVTLNHAFGRVVRGCAAPRPGQSGTWLIPDMIKAYERLRDLGYAHSVETWLNGKLVGGLYGVLLGKAFFGESMFHLVPEASRMALSALVSLLRTWEVELIDCQQTSAHMLRMGAAPVPRDRFLEALARALGEADMPPTKWFCPWKPRPEKYSYNKNSGAWVNDKLNRSLFPALLENGVEAELK